MLTDESVLLDLKHLLMEAKQKVPQFLASMQADSEIYLDVGGQCVCFVCVCVCVCVQVCVWSCVCVYVHVAYVSVHARVCPSIVKWWEEL